MAFLKAGDTISGQEGRAYATINGQVEEMFYIKSLEATIEKQKTEVRTLGKRGVQHKATGWTGSGTMTMYYVTTLFRRLMLDYIKNGRDVYFDVTIVNEDPTSSIGRQTVVLKNVNLDSVMAARLDTETEVLDEEISFTFDDVDIMDSFVNPA